MTRISSGATFFFKRVFPMMWFGFLIVFAGVVIVSGAAGDDLGGVFMLAQVAFMAAIGLVIMKKLVWDLVDEVYDHGDYLVIRNRGDEARVELGDITHVNVSTHLHPPRVRLRVSKPTRFGTEISFSPVHPFSINPFARNEVGEQLILRVDRARSARRP